MRINSEALRIRWNNSELILDTVAESNRPVAILRTTTHGSSFFFSPDLRMTDIVLSKVPVGDALAAAKYFSSQDVKSVSQQSSVAGYTAISRLVYCHVHGDYK